MMQRHELTASEMDDHFDRGMGQITETLLPDTGGVPKPGRRLVGRQGKSRTAGVRQSL